SARALLGPLGGTVVAVFVLASILGTLNATVLVGPRIPYAMALDRLFFRGVDATHPRFGTPHIAIVLQGLVSVVLLGIFQGFPDSLFASALDYTVFAIVLATMADTLALYRLRRARHHGRHPGPLPPPASPARPPAPVPGLGLPVGAGDLHRGECLDRLRDASPAALRVRRWPRRGGHGLALLRGLPQARQWPRRGPSRCLRATLDEARFL
ncbi:MAG: APC family permease, partial [Deltaproteobacteria bacterium]|nr:APC family permease [Deltaproteobacteria bacterium]